MSAVFMFFHHSNSFLSFLSKLLFGSFLVFLQLSSMRRRTVGLPGLM